MHDLRLCLVSFIVVILVF